MKSHPILLAATLVSAQLASGDTIAIDVGANSAIRTDLGNQGTSQILFAGDTTTAFLRSAEAVNLSNPLPTGTTINSVTLSFYVRVEVTQNQSR